MTVVFYISGHGFGHASRQVEIINALAARMPHVRLVIRSAVSPDLLARTLTAPFDLRPGPCDTGIVQSSSITHDDEATVAAARAFHATFEERVGNEAAALSDDAVRLIVGDIPPLAFDVAHRLSVPSVAIGNFTWDWIYETHPGFEREPAILERLRRAYARADLALELPFAGGFERFSRVERLPLVARHARRGRAEARRHFGLPPDRPVALLSFGGYGLPSLDLSRLDCLDRWAVATTDRVSGPAGALPPGIVHIPEASMLGAGFRYEDLVAASDVVVSKPGYGIIAECITSGAPLLYTSRGAFREYDLLLREMPRYLRVRFIAPHDLLGGRWRDALDALVAQPSAPECLRTDGADVAANRLADLIRASAR